MIVLLVQCKGQSVYIAMMAITFFHTVLCLTTEPYAEVQFRKMSQSFEGRLTAGRGIINGTLSRDSFVSGLGCLDFRLVL